MRKFVEETIAKEASTSEDAGNPPSKELFAKMGQSGMLAARIGPGKHLNLVSSLPGGIKPEEFDYFQYALFHTIC